MADPTVKLTIGVSAFDEGPSIGSALASLIAAAERAGGPWELMVVASGCNDDTVLQAERALANVKNSTILVEAERRGKVCALNRIVRAARGDVVVFCDADVLVALNSLGILQRAFASDPTLTLAYGRVVAMPGPSPFWSAIGARSAAALDSYRSLPNGAGLWLICGHLYAVRTSSWPGLPSDVVVDDISAGVAVAEVGLSVRYLRDAVVHVRYPQTFGDYLQQKMRNRLGRRQLRD